MHTCLMSSYVVIFRDIFRTDVNSAYLCWLYYNYISFISAKFLVPHHQTNLQGLTNIDQMSSAKSKIMSSVKKAPDSSDQQYSWNFNCERLF